MITLIRPESSHLWSVATALVKEYAASFVQHQQVNVANGEQAVGRSPNWTGTGVAGAGRPLENER
jgi:hypothetical protein